MDEAVAAAAIQRMWRCNCARFEIRWRVLAAQDKDRRRRRHQGAALVQGQWRMHEARRRCKTLRKDQVSTAPGLQADDITQDETFEDSLPSPRGVQHSIAPHNAAAVIQRAYRVHNAFFEARWRSRRRTGCRERARQEEEAEFLYSVLALLQRVGRGGVARVGVFRDLKEAVARIPYETMRRKLRLQSALRIQAAWRNYNAKVRSHLEIHARFKNSELKWNTGREMLSIDEYIQQRGGEELYSSLTLTL